LIDFEDAPEKVKVRGPLFATAAKFNVPVFGHQRFQSPKSQTLLNTTIEMSLRSAGDPIVDLLASMELERNQSQWLNDTRISTSRLDGEESREEVTADSLVSNKTYSSREVHDKSHYSTLSLSSSNKPRSELLDHVMLRRALNGYLFDCKINKVVATDDKWLRNLWDWIQGNFHRVLAYYIIANRRSGAEEAAEDDGMASRPLDLSYMGVYTIWMNLLGETAGHSICLC
jgi:SEA/GATOR complex protein SEA4/MIOS